MPDGIPKTCTFGFFPGHCSRFLFAAAGAVLPYSATVIATGIKVPKRAYSDIYGM